MSGPSNTGAGNSSSSSRHEDRHQPTSWHMGVHLDARSGKWRANFKHNQAEYYVGTFENEIDAAKTLFIKKVQVMSPTGETNPEITKYFGKIIKICQQLKSNPKVSQDFVENYVKFYSTLMKAFEAQSLDYSASEPKRNSTSAPKKVKQYQFDFNPAVDIMVDKSKILLDLDYETIFEPKSPGSSAAAAASFRDQDMYSREEQEMLKLLADDDLDFDDDPFAGILEPINEAFLDYIESKQRNDSLKRDTQQNPSLNDKQQGANQGKDDDTGNKNKRLRQ